MGCREGNDPADFDPGAIDPGDDPANPLPDISVDDTTAVTDPDQTIWARFAVTMTNINFTDAVTFRYTTSNGSASAGTHYVAASNVLVTIAIGGGSAVIAVQVLKPSGATGSKTFTIALSSPANCTIEDGSATATINYGTGGGDPDPCPPDCPDPDPDDSQYLAWDANGNHIVTEQFDGQNSAYRFACTGASVGTTMSALLWRQKGQNIDVDWEALYRAAGGCIFCTGVCAPDGNRPAYCTGCGGCNGHNPVQMLNRLRTHGVQEVNSSKVHKARAEVLNDSNDSMLQVRTKIKNALKATGVVHLMSKWYGDSNDPQRHGWNRCFSCNGFTLRNPIASGPYGAQNPVHNTPPCNHWSGSFSGSGLHAWSIIGWNDNKAGGAFRIQHSGGREWGEDGRCWLPYSYMGNGSGWRYWKMVYTGQS